MPRVAAASKAATAARAVVSNSNAACDPPLDVAPASTTVSMPRTKNYTGFGEGVCTCARCMRRAGPVREDVENKLVQITYALANVYDDTPDLDSTVTEHHRAMAEEFMSAVEAGDVARLAELFADVEDDPDLEDGTASEIATYLIISAAQVGQAEVIRLLADWGADLEETDSIRKGRPLMHAANNGHTAAVRALIECGANTEAQDDNGYTALMVAVFSDRSSAAETLLDYGASVDTTDRHGRTALSYAAMYGSTDCIYLLANRGADVFLVDRDGHSPLDLAEDSGRQSALDALRKLQLRVKMQEKRQRNKARSAAAAAEGAAANGAADGAVSLAEAEAAAARRADELLLEIEREQREAAEKAARAAKKKKKSKVKGHEDECTEAAAQEGQADAKGPDALKNGKDRQRPGVSKSSQRHRTDHDPWPRGDACSDSGEETVPMKLRHHVENGRVFAAHEAKANGAAAAASVSVGKGAAAANGTAKLQPRGKGASNGVEDGHASDQRHASAMGAPLANGTAHKQQPSSSPAPASPLAAGSDASQPLHTNVDALRREWDALCEAAAKCMEEAEQPTMLARVESLLPLCVEAGISVKYGRKVLQRLQCVGPARSALRAALKSKDRVGLDEALKACKTVRCLLDEAMVHDAEALHDKLHKEELERWAKLADQLSWQPGTPAPGQPTAASSVPQVPEPRSSAASDSNSSGGSGTAQPAAVLPPQTPAQWQAPLVAKLTVQPAAPVAAVAAATPVAQQHAAQQHVAQQLPHQPPLQKAIQPPQKQAVQPPVQQPQQQAPQQPPPHLLQQQQQQQQQGLRQQPAAQAPLLAQSQPQQLVQPLLQQLHAPPQPLPQQQVQQHHLLGPNALQQLQQTPVPTTLQQLQQHHQLQQQQLQQQQQNAQASLLNFSRPQPSLPQQLLPQMQRMQQAPGPNYLQQLQAQQQHAQAQQQAAQQAQVQQQLAQQQAAAQLQQLQQQQAQAQVARALAMAQAAAQLQQQQQQQLHAAAGWPAQFATQAFASGNGMHNVATSLGLAGGLGMGPRQPPAQPSLLSLAAVVQQQQHQLQQQQQAAQQQQAQQAQQLLAQHQQQLLKQQQQQQQQAAAKLGPFQSAAPAQRHHNGVHVETLHPAYAMAHALLDDTLDAENECVVCLSKVKDTCCVPCGHVCMCRGCAADVQEQSGVCPVCRARIECCIEMLT